MENDNIQVPAADELNEGSNTSTADDSTPNDGNAVDETVEGESQGESSTSTSNSTPNIGKVEVPPADNVADKGNSADETDAGSNTDKEEFVLTLDSDTWFSVSQAQKVFGISRDQLRKRDAEPPFKIPAVKRNGAYYFRESDLQAFKASLNAKTPRQTSPANDTDTSLLEVDGNSATSTVLVLLADIATDDGFNLDNVTSEIKFYISVANQSIIEVGKRLNLVKAKLPHGDWARWLKDNFDFTQQTANRFMRVAERFGKLNIDVKFNTTQYIALLDLPADETEKFIAEKAAAGTPVEEMKAKQLRDEISLYKSKLADAEKQLDEKNVMLSNAENELKNLREKPVDVKAVEMPKDYSATKKANAELTKENTALKAKIDTLKSDKAIQYTSAISLMQSLINFSKALADVDEDIFTAAVKHFGEMTSTVTDVARRIKKVGE